jgi:hypothetical protein
MGDMSFVVLLEIPDNLKTLKPGDWIFNIDVSVNDDTWFVPIIEIIKGNINEFNIITSESFMAKGRDCTTDHAPDTKP